MPAATTDDPRETIQRLRDQADAAIGAAATPDDVEAFRIRFLSKNGEIRDLMKLLGRVPKEDRPALGQEVNKLQNEVQASYDAKKSSLETSDEAPVIDVTEPGDRPAVGRRHPVLRVVDELSELFGRMGFDVGSGPELEDEFHNFVALNIPESHPARDPLDNFYVDDAADGGPGAGGRSLLRTQTSTVQIRTMQSQEPPIRIVIPGRVYRPDTHDDTHLSMFHQLEALVVDEGVTMVDMKSTILQFVRAYFGHDTQVRLRPSFFPFTEPSAECDVWFPDREQWIELGGCGMVHPNVLTACGIDPDLYTGWAFGFGVERIAMRKYGVGNIRHFVENDVRFLRSL